MADLEFFFDPVCPWAWITSRWVSEVQQLRNYEVAWRFISLRMLNNERGYAAYPEYEDIHNAGLYALRVASAARTHAGNDAVAKVYTGVGTAVHVNKRRADLLADPQAFFAVVLGDAGLATELSRAWDDGTHDEVIRYETESAIERTGKDVGTPILTFHPGSDREASLFGPVISRTPRGAEALKLWDAVETLAASGVAEIKRSLRSTPDFS